MKPHEKAKDIYQKMFNNMPHPDETNAAVFTITKQCALIAVDEVIEFMEADDFDSDTSYWANHSKMQYWVEVKQEIQNL
jgi:hypothetical protein